VLNQCLAEPLSLILRVHKHVPYGSVECMVGRRPRKTCVCEHHAYGCKDGMNVLANVQVGLAKYQMQSRRVAHQPSTPRRASQAG